MRAAVVLFPGLNADAEMVRTLGDVCGANVQIVRHTETELPRAGELGIDLVAIPGGFSYGDYLRCGALAKVSPIVPALRAHAKRGAYVLGVCNGFQILTEMGLLEGALTRNLHRRFECSDVDVRVEHEGPFTPSKGTIWRLPIAHAEGRWQATPDVVKRLEDDGCIGLRYVDETGEPSERANPNGSIGNVAGIYGGPDRKLRNVFGLMPHPERRSEDAVANGGSSDGRALFDLVLSR